jgi:hypothetical protein
MSGGTSTISRTCDLFSAKLPHTSVASASKATWPLLAIAEKRLDPRDVGSWTHRSLSNARGGCPVTRLNTREKAAALS